MDHRRHRIRKYRDAMIGEEMEEGGGRLRALLADGVKGLFWASLPAIIRLSLGDSLINAAFLQLTCKVTGMVGAQPLPSVAAPEEGNGRIIHFPRGLSASRLLHSPASLPLCPAPPMRYRSSQSSVSSVPDRADSSPRLPPPRFNLKCNQKGQ